MDSILRYCYGDYDGHFYYGRSLGPVLANR